MIKQTSLRRLEDGTNILLGKGEVPSTKALENMVLFELGFGGFVTDLSPTKVVVETHVLGKKDTTIFEGPPEEMEFIVKVAAHHVMIRRDETMRSALVEGAVAFLGTLPKEVGGLPLYMAMVTPFLMGGQLASVALLFAVGITDPEVVKTLLPISLKELVAAVELSRKTGTPIPEIVREMTPATP